MSDTSKDPKSPKDETANSEKPAVTLPGTVEKIIPASESTPEIAQIFISCADGTFAEIRVKNNLQDKCGQLAGLSKGAHVR